MPPLLGERGAADEACPALLPVGRSSGVCCCGEVVVAPALANLGLLDFHRSGEAIAEGRRAAQASLPQLRRFMG